jgi:DNA-binding NtrC family response regulator
VRELRNAVEHAFILSDDEIEIAHLPASLVARQERTANGTAAATRPTEGGLSVEVPATLADVERRVILATLDALGSDKSRAANALGISLKTLYSRLREYSARTDA